jgi:soluble lytic murein transglycosylase-like protein
LIPKEKFPLIGASFWGSAIMDEFPSFGSSVMSRLLCLIVLSLGLMQTAAADENTDRMTAYLTQKFGLAKEKAQKISDAVQSAASKYSLPPALLLAIISIESRFKEKARGANGATGLMQVVPGAHRGLLRNVKDLTEPTANIEVGSAILYGYMRSANGDMNAALKSYGGSQAYAQKVSLSRISLPLPRRKTPPRIPMRRPTCAKQIAAHQLINGPMRSPCRLSVPLA